MPKVANEVNSHYQKNIDTNNKTPKSDSLVSALKVIEGLDFWGVKAIQQAHMEQEFAD